MRCASTLLKMMLHRHFWASTITADQSHIMWHDNQPITHHVTTSGPHNRHQHHNVHCTLLCVRNVTGCQFHQHIDMTHTFSLQSAILLNTASMSHACGITGISRRVCGKWPNTSNKDQQHLYRIHKSWRKSIVYKLTGCNKKDAVEMAGLCLRMQNSTKQCCTTSEWCRHQCTTGPFTPLCQIMTSSTNRKYIKYSTAIRTEPWPQ